MKSTRLLGYAALGIIIGLLSENAAMRIKQKARKKVHELKDEAGNTIHKARKRFARLAHH